MYVPNYIPDTVEVPNGITLEPYRVRLRFIRRVSVLHFLSLLLIAGLSMLPLPDLPLRVSVPNLAVLLLILSIVRIGTRATRYDLIVSGALLPFLIGAIALIVRRVDHGGWPLWGAMCGAAASVVYALACGRDFSFVGQFLLSLIASSVVLAVAATGIGLEPPQAAFLMGANAIYLFYLVYDLASLLFRRRLGEELGAVVDLYRDVFNIFGYLVRVGRHWREHRIWAR